MCFICEKFNIGDRLPVLRYEGHCGACGSKTDLVIISGSRWVKNDIDINSFFTHVTDYKYTCKSCGLSSYLAIFCGGIDGGALFAKESESVDTRKKDVV